MLGEISHYPIPSHFLYILVLSSKKNFFSLRVIIIRSWDKQDRLDRSIHRPKALIPAFKSKILAFQALMHPGMMVVATPIYLMALFVAVLFEFQD